MKASENPVGPGPNYFSDSIENVWVDEDGMLHLRITFRDGIWNCAEVITIDTVGYGTYIFQLASRVDQLDRNVVLGLFTWDDMAPEHNYREIDIEFARWGEESAQNAQFVVQPWFVASNTYRFDVDLGGVYSIHYFDWRVDSILFSIYRGNAHPPSLDSQVESWLYTGNDIPPEGGSNARINLWLFNENPPSDSQEVEVIVRNFEFVPGDGQH